MGHTVNAALYIKDLEQKDIDLFLEIMWRELEDVPVDENESGELILVEDWYHFNAGTDRDEIWHWFDDNHSHGVAYLMFELE